MTHASVNGGGRRARGPQRREYVVKAKLTAAEKASLTVAGRARLAPAACLARAGRDAAGYRAVPVLVLWRSMLAELVLVCGGLR